MNKFFTATIAATTMLVSFSAYADVTDMLKKALIDDATPYINSRYRFENVDQNGFTKDANASTLRTNLGYKSGKFYDFSATVEVENVVYLGNDNFNNTINGKTQYPVVADPDGTELNQAFITYTGLQDTVMAVGRQAVNLDNQRFIGTVGWRQNDQTYDAAVIINKSLPNTTLLYGYVSNVNRIFGNDHPLGDLNTDTHLINASYDGFGFGKLTGYGYLIDLNNPAVYGLSSKTFGLRFSGNTKVSNDLKLLYTAEYARQSDYKDNPINFGADYAALEGGIGYKGLTVKAGYEELGSDNNGTVSFQTPLATGHKFNGWADKFLSTPATGLEDIYVSAGYKISSLSNAMDGTKLFAAYHDFSAETGGADYGTELDAVISQNFKKHYSMAVRYADYNANSFSTDTQKLWLELGAKF